MNTYAIKMIKTQTLVSTRCYSAETELEAIKQAKVLVDCMSPEIGQQSEWQVQSVRKLSEEELVELEIVGLAQMKSLCGEK